MNVSRPIGPIVRASTFIVPPPLARPRYLRGYKAAADFVSTLGPEFRGRLLALFVDDSLRLLSIELLANRPLADAQVGGGALVAEASALGASGFVLVSNFLPTDSAGNGEDLLASKKLRDFTREHELHLLCHLIRDRDGVRKVRV